MLDHSSIPEFSVTQISNSIKMLLEANFGIIKVRGEISGFKLATSGHAYFNLKEDLAVIGCTCWRPVMNKLEIVMEDGIEVIITGKISSYAGQSKYQLTVEKIEPAGVGAWMKILHARQEKLAKEGLFDKEHKKPLPFIPKTIGVITAITGAVIKDIIHRITERFPTRVIIWSVAVQGDNAANDIVNAIEGFNKIQLQDRPDVIIIARGGGSIEDLMPFNEESVVRSAFASLIPIISSIGHETDYTLLDMVADVRAPTPTAAAEFAMPVLADLKYKIQSMYSRYNNSVSQYLKYQSQYLQFYSNFFEKPLNLLDFNQQKLDELSFKLNDTISDFLYYHGTTLSRFKLDKTYISQYIDYKTLILNSQYNKFNMYALQTIDKCNNRLILNSKLLSSLDYSNTLKRGFTITTTLDGQVISSHTESMEFENLKIKFYDGELNVKKSND